MSQKIKFHIEPPHTRPPRIRRGVKIKRTYPVLVLDEPCRDILALEEAVYRELCRASRQERYNAKLRRYQAECVKLSERGVPQEELPEPPMDKPLPKSVRLHMRRTARFLARENVSKAPAKVKSRKVCKDGHRKTYYKYLKGEITMKRMSCAAATSMGFHNSPERAKLADLILHSEMGPTEIAKHIVDGYIGPIPDRRDILYTRTSAAKADPNFKAKLARCAKQ